MAIDSVLHTNSQSVDRVLATGLPILLIFWQQNVPQSTELDPILNQLAARYAGRALIAKVDAEAEPDLVKRYEIRLLPSIVGIKQGKAEVTLAGRVSDQAVQEWLTYLVEGGVRPAQASGAGIPTSTGKPLHANGTNHQSSSQAATASGKSSASQAAPQNKPQDKPQTVTDANFDQVINGQMPVLVDFWAEWCGPCRMVAPSVEQLAQEFAGRAVVAKLNVDQNPRTSHRFNIMSIPALYIFKGGEVIDRIVGAQPLPVLRQRLTQALAA
jgi:thioredoxin 1